MGAPRTLESLLHPAVFLPQDTGRDVLVPGDEGQERPVHGARRVLKVIFYDVGLLERGDAE